MDRQGDRHGQGNRHTSATFIAKVTRIQIPCNNFTLGNYIAENYLARISRTVGDQEIKGWLGNLLEETT